MSARFSFLSPPHFDPFPLLPRPRDLEQDTRISADLRHMRMVRAFGGCAGRFGGASVVGVRAHGGGGAAAASAFRPRRLFVAPMFVAVLLLFLLATPARAISATAHPKHLERHAQRGGNVIALVSSERGLGDLRAHG